MTRFILTVTGELFNLNNVRSIDPIPENATSDTRVTFTVERWVYDHCKADTHVTTVAELKRLSIIPPTPTDDPFRK